MKKIKIFFASSIIEFENERKELYVFVENLSRKFRKKYNIDIEPFICENNSFSVTKEERMQTVYNSEIQKSDIVCFIFFTDAGKFTSEEFDVAYKQMQETDKPHILVFLKERSAGDSINKSLKKILDKIGNEKGQYIDEFSHIDTIKNRILFEIHSLDLNFITMRTSNGFCFFDEEAVLSLDNVDEVANNTLLKELKYKLQYIEKLHYDMTVTYDKNAGNPDFELKYKHINEQIQTIRKYIEDVQRKIMQVSIDFCNSTVNNSITPRQKNAYHHFEKGDTLQAIQELNSTDIMRDFNRVESDSIELVKDAARKCIAEQRLAIKLLLQNEYEWSVRTLSEVKKRYNEIIPIALKYIVDVSIIYEYIMFLDNIDIESIGGSEKDIENQSKELLTLSMQLYNIYKQKPSLCNSIYNIYDVCSIISENLPAEDLSLKWFEFDGIYSVMEYLNNVEDKTSFYYAHECMCAAELPGNEDNSVGLYKRAITVLESLESSEYIEELLEFCRRAIE